MFIIVGREIPLKNSTPSEDRATFLDKTQDPFNIFRSVLNTTNPAYGYNPMVHNHQMGSIIKKC